MSLTTIKEIRQRETLLNGEQNGSKNPRDSKPDNGRDIEAEFPSIVAPSGGSSKNSINNSSSSKSNSNNSYNKSTNTKDTKKESDSSNSNSNHSVENSNSNTNMDGEDASINDSKSSDKFSHVNEGDVRTLLNDAPRVSQVKRADAQRRVAGADSRKRDAVLNRADKIKEATIAFEKIQREIDLENARKAEKLAREGVSNKNKATSANNRNSNSRSSNNSVTRKSATEDAISSNTIPSSNNSTRLEEAKKTLENKIEEIDAEFAAIEQQIDAEFEATVECLKKKLEDAKNTGRNSSRLSRNSEVNMVITSGSIITEGAIIEGEQDKKASALRQAEIARTSELQTKRRELLDAYQMIKSEYFAIAQAQRDPLLKSQKEFKERLTVLYQRRESMEKLCVVRFKGLDGVEKQLRVLNQKLAHEGCSNIQSEKKLVREIEQLKKEYQAAKERLANGEDVWAIYNKIRDEEKRIKPSKNDVLKKKKQEDNRDSDVVSVASETTSVSISSSTTAALTNNTTTKSQTNTSNLTEVNGQLNAVYKRLGELNDSMDKKWAEVAAVEKELGIRREPQPRTSATSTSTETTSTEAATETANNSSRASVSRNSILDNARETAIYKRDLAKGRGKVVENPARTSAEQQQEAARIAKEKAARKSSKSLPEGDDVNAENSKNIGKKGAGKGKMDNSKSTNSSPSLRSQLEKELYTVREAHYDGNRLAEKARHSGEQAELHRKREVVMANRGEDAAREADKAWKTHQTGLRKNAEHHHRLYTKMLEEAIANCRSLAGLPRTKNSLSGDAKSEIDLRTSTISNAMRPEESNDRFPTAGLKVLPAKKDREEDSIFGTKKTSKKSQNKRKSSTLDDGNNINNTIDSSKKKNSTISRSSNKNSTAKEDSAESTVKNNLPVKLGVAQEQALNRLNEEYLTKLPLPATGLWRRSDVQTVVDEMEARLADAEQRKNAKAASSVSSSISTTNNSDHKNSSSVKSSTGGNDDVILKWHSRIEKTKASIRREAKQQAWETHIENLAEEAGMAEEHRCAEKEPNFALCTSTNNYTVLQPNHAYNYNTSATSDGTASDSEHTNIGHYANGNIVTAYNNSIANDDSYNNNYNADDNNGNDYSYYNDYYYNSANSNLAEKDIVTTPTFVANNSDVAL